VRRASASDQARSSVGVARWKVTRQDKSVAAISITRVELRGKRGSCSSHAGSAPHVRPTHRDLRVVGRDPAAGPEKREQLFQRLLLGTPALACARRRAMQTAAETRNLSHSRSACSRSYFVRERQPARGLKTLLRVPAAAERRTEQRKESMMRRRVVRSSSMMGPIHGSERHG